MSLDATARALADRLVNQFGKTITVRRTTRTSYDGSTGTGGIANAPVDYPDLKVTPPKDFMFKKIDGTLVQAGDQVVSLPALKSPIVPNEDTDVIIYDGLEWKIRQLGYLYSGELVALYIIHLSH